MGREISLREDSRGGERRDELVGTGDVFTERYRFVLLVHGFNRSRKKSKKLFTSFRENIRAFSNNLAEDMYEVYWPGDAYLPVIRTVMYPYKINEAKECGVLLADYLAKRKAPRNSKINIILIGHSLGCRLLLEALRDLSGKNLNKVTIHLVLMAAAVPKRFVESGGVFTQEQN